MQQPWIHHIRLMVGLLKNMRLNCGHATSSVRKFGRFTTLQVCNSVLFLLCNTIDYI